ncbi:MAG TPA: DUF881 domain-containing protein [Coriobacteriia bacterium]
MLAAVVVILGFMLALAFNSNARVRGARPERSSNLAGAVRDIETQRSALQTRLADLRTSMSTLERKAADEAGMRESFSRELETARAAAGLTAVSGPGVEVVVADASEVPAGSDPNDAVVHDFDIAAIVNALVNAGAEAVSVNGERVVATTAIRCAGNTILVNSTRLGNPYTVRAIGDAGKLAEGLASDPESGPVIKTYHSRFGLTVSVSEERSVEVPPYLGSLRPSYARSAKEGSTS